MYFPYLRGKQFELLALRELAPILDSSKIIPLIEPVKTNTTSLKTAIDVLAKYNIKAQVILNPEVGDFKSNNSSLITFFNQLQAQGYTNLIPSFIISSDRAFDRIKTIIADNHYDTNGFSFVHLNKVSDLDALQSFSSSNHCLYHVVQIAHLFAMRRKLRGNVCMLNDYFNRLSNNKAYLDVPFEVFSSDYMYYQDEGCVGFSDYQVIGKDYSETGGAAFAVAIHLTYKEEGSDDIQVAHFVSDSNEGRENPAGKFFEALEKLIAFVDQKQLTSFAIDKFRDYYNTQAYPGLGVVKKLSIMHHIQLIQGLI